MITIFFNALSYLFFRQNELINHLLIEITKINDRCIDAGCVFTSCTERKNFSVNWRIRDKYWQLCQSCLSCCIAALVSSAIEKVMLCFSMRTNVKCSLEAIGFDRLYKRLEVIVINCL